MTAIAIPPEARWPSGAPPIRVYQEALEFQIKRTPMLSGEYYSRAMDIARPRAFTITGLTKHASLLEAHRLGEQATRSNMTMSDYADALGEIVDEHGGTILSPSRLELIHHNTMANNNAAGAWKQMHDPEFLADRPYFQYLGEAGACPICSPLRGLIVHYTDPILRHIWPPNHHWCSCEWISLAADDVDPTQVYKSPDGHEYPVIGGRVIRPADGWDHEPSDVFAADDTAFTHAVAELDMAAPLRRKTPADYGLGDLLEAEPGSLPAWPDLPQAITRLDDPRAQFEAIFGFAGEARTILMDYGLDGVWVTGDSFTALGGEDLDVFAMAAATLQEPAEVWFVPAAAKANGDTTYIKRYLGVFARGDERVAGWVDRSPDGWLMGGGLADAGAMSRLRSGLLTYARKARKP